MGLRDGVRAMAGSISLSDAAAATSDVIARIFAKAFDATLTSAASPNLFCCRIKAWPQVRPLPLVCLSQQSPDHLAPFPRRATLNPVSPSRCPAQPQAMLPGTRPVCLTGFPRPCLSQSSDCTSRPGHSAEGLMPKAARERVASPRAGTALARVASNASQAASEKGEIRR
jgi:hypothetical protein